MTLAETKRKTLADEKNRMVYLMDFVQEFRRNPSLDTLKEPFESPVRFRKRHVFALKNFLDRV
ncbi:MAG: hypothetical protein NZM06_02045 [Chloroherpetonaceae bacterium]|nr:hypothetical protein [Chloroherpetonaceae bacterium]MDW8438447.1 hypothetical protein [Chloroherpetonaceae bacterium]